MVLMRISWKLGRVAGIDIYVHPTFLLILLMPPMLGEGYVGLSLVLLLAAFGCVLLHELGHALMARRFGIETEDITLYPIGGVARLRRLPRSPGAELLIALAGPAVNVTIAAGLGLMGHFGLFGLERAQSLLGLFALELLLVNIGLAVFNLIPAFPMDGGRVLRALLSGWLGRVRATRLAAGLGRGLALAFALAGLWFGQLMWVVLAAFIFLAAGAELAGVVNEERRRAYQPHAGEEGIWMAPPGYHWVEQGNGVWQLVPVIVTLHDGTPPEWH
jgi:Zn-dependent protease